MAMHRKARRPRWWPNRLSAGRHMLPGVAAEAMAQLRQQDWANYG